MPQSRTPLARIKDLPTFRLSGIRESFVDRDLPALGITAAEDFLGLLLAVPEGVAEATGASQGDLEQLYREGLESLVGAEHRDRFEKKSVTPAIFGAASATERGLPEITAAGLDQFSMTNEFPGPGILPPDISLLDGCMPESRDQGRRPTCTAFVASGILEYLLCRFQGIRVDLSEQYLYWLLSQNGILDADGRALLADVFEIARTAGVCQEHFWKYEGDNRLGDLTHGNPPDPDACQSDAALHRFDTVRPLANPKDVDTIRQILSSDHPVAVALPVYPTLTQEPFYSEGRIVLPFPMTTPSERHAIVLVGYRAAADEPGGEVFLVRNSLGLAWGVNSSVRPGCGTISVEYVRLYAEEAWTAEV